MKKKIIAIDGPAGVGKSTVSQIIAHKLVYHYIDTGAMYRTLTWLVLNQGCNILDQASILKIAKTIDFNIYFLNDKVYILDNGKDITQEIRTPEVSRFVSEIAKIPEIRKIMLYLQRKMAKQNDGIVMDGRDIGTHVLPYADCKIFLTASIKIRAERRKKELLAKGYEIDFFKLKNELATRDRTDSERNIAPLKQAKDAVLIDTTYLLIDQVVEKIIKIVEDK